MCVGGAWRSEGIISTIATVVRHGLLPFFYFATPFALTDAPLPPDPAGAIPLLVGVLRSGTDAAKQHAARALRNLGGLGGCLRVACACRFFLLDVPASAVALSQSLCSWLASQAVQAIDQPGLPSPCPPRPAAGRDTQNKLATASAGGIPLLVSLMAGAEGASDSTRQAAASALRCSLSCRLRDGFRACVVALSGLVLVRAGRAGNPFLCSVHRLSPIPAFPPSLTRCSNIACNCEQTQKAIVAENALPALADLLHPESGCSSGCREAAAWALSNLACSAEVRNELG